MNQIEVNVVMLFSNWLPSLLDNYLALINNAIKIQSQSLKLKDKLKNYISFKEDVVEDKLLTFLWEDLTKNVINQKHQLTQFNQPTPLSHQIQLNKPILKLQQMIQFQILDKKMVKLKKQQLKRLKRNFMNQQLKKKNHLDLKIYQKV